MRTRPALFAATLLVSGINVAVAQAPPAAAEITGTVRMFKLTPVGDLEGFILNDGMEVHFPPHLSQQLAAAVRPGDRVEVRGWQTTTPDFVVGTSVTDTRSGETVVDQGPPPPGTMPPPPPPGHPAPGAQWSSVQGRVRQDLHGPAGDINGAVLADGTELKLPPAAYQVSGWLQPGETIAARGYLLANRFGRVMDVQAIGPSPDRLAQVGWVGPPGPGGAPPAPPGPGPAAAPPRPSGPSQR